MSVAASHAEKMLSPAVQPVEKSAWKTRTWCSPGAMAMASSMSEVISGVPLLTTGV